MNCNKKSHFDGVTPVHGQEGGGFGYVSVCKEEVLSQALEKEREQREGSGERSKKRGRKRKRFSEVRCWKDTIHL